jgi:hypothetical protein
MEEFHNVLGQLLDAVWRGICLLVCFAVLWPGVVLILKYTPKTLKGLGVWPS